MSTERIEARFQMTPLPTVLGSLLLFGVIVGAVVVFPTFETADKPSDIFRRRSALEEAGYRHYKANGCFYCHSQYVRYQDYDYGHDRVAEPGDYLDGPPLAPLLAACGVPLAGPEGPALELVAVASRLPLAAEETERLRALCRARPTVLLGLRNDAFLDDLPEAALRLSASDSTLVTRRVVARLVAGLRQGAAATT